MHNDKEILWTGVELTASFLLLRFDKRGFSIGVALLEICYKGFFLVINPKKITFCVK